eukprot:1271678-Pleurochrysis_carterae.AAC.1
MSEVNAGWTAESALTCAVCRSAVCSTPLTATASSLTPRLLAIKNFSGLVRELVCASAENARSDLRDAVAACFMGGSIYRATLARCQLKQLAPAYSLLDRALKGRGSAPLSAASLAFWIQPQSRELR